MNPRFAKKLSEKSSQAKDYYRLYLTMFTRAPDIGQRDHRPQKEDDGKPSQPIFRLGGSKRRLVSRRFGFLRIQYLGDGKSRCSMRD